MPPGIPLRGLTLAPLTLGHLLLLHRVESPYVSDADPRPDPTPGQTALALWICSRPWRAAAARLGSRLARLRMLWIGSAVAHAPGWYAERFAEYLAFHRQPPRTRSLRGGSGEKLPPLGATLVASLKVAMMTDLGIPEDDVLDKPVAACLWDLAVLSEGRGNVKILSEREALEERHRDDDLIAAARQIAAENFARLKGAPCG